MELLLLGKRFYLMKNCKSIAGADYNTAVSPNLRDNHKPPATYSERETGKEGANPNDLHQ